MVAQTPDKMNQAGDVPYTLITGASSGIGRAIALECARRNMNLLIVALPGAELEETATYIRRHYRIMIDYLGVDLTETDGPGKVFDWVRDQKYIVNILVNNAGIAGSAVFTEADPDYSDVRIQLNIRALVMMTHLFLPRMLEAEAAYILNIGSLSGFYPIAYKSVYAASKAFVLSFSLGLGEELRGTPVSISIVCPNAVRTNSGTHGRIDSHGWIGRAAEVSAERIARTAVDKMFRGKVIIIPGLFNRILYYFSKLLPRSMRVRIASREIRKELSG
jgi:short-subunit dehydrogenase